MSSITKEYPWTAAPLIIGAPMRLISGPPLAHAVSSAQGLGFLAAGTDVSSLASELEEYKSLLSRSPIPNVSTDILPIGIGFILWGASLPPALSVLSQPGNAPSAAWLFAPQDPSDLKVWSDSIRKATNGKTKIWIQVSSVAAALSAVQQASPDVLVIQSSDSGGHGTYASAGLIPLVPEVIDTVSEFCSTNNLPLPHFVAAGGISDSRGVNAVLALGAEGAVLGTRYLASSEAKIAKGYQDAVLRAKDGGLNTVRTDVYDTLRGTPGWPKEYGGRGVVNASYKDAMGGMEVAENAGLYEAALRSGDKGWEGEEARLTTYVGTGVGMVKKVLGAGEITREVRGEK